MAGLQPRLGQRVAFHASREDCIVERQSLQQKISLSSRDRWMSTVLLASAGRQAL